jgi:hypothetical protein
MARGNQRDEARAKNEKKKAGENAGRTDGKSLTKAKEDDAEIMRRKQAAAAEKKAAAAK